VGFRGVCCLRGGHPGERKQGEGGDEGSAKVRNSLLY
jgi:hypothetical protein